MTGPLAAAPKSKPPASRAGSTLARSLGLTRGSYLLVLFLASFLKPVIGARGGSLAFLLVAAHNATNELSAGDGPRKPKYAL